MILRSPWLCLFLAACAHPKTARSDAHAAPDAATPTATPALDASAAGSPGVVVTDLEPGVFLIEATSPTRLKTQATLERKTGSGWEALNALDLGRGYRLVAKCADDAPCVDVAPGRPLVPVPWSGFNCSAQCNGTCRANSFEGPGSFRLVVRSCEGATSVAGPEFDLPDALHAHDLERWGLVSDVVKVTVARLDPPTERGFDVAAPAAPGRIAAFAVRAGSEHALDAAATAELVKLVRDNKGFDDRTADRCASRHLVGFRVERSPRSTGGPHTDVAEIALDFACKKLFAAHRGGALPRQAIATSFAPSRSAFLALVKRALPGDREIGKLR